MIVMLKKRDLFDKWGKRLCALFLSAEMALGSVSGMVLNVHAANIQFNFQNLAGSPGTSTSIVAGSTIPIQGRIPSSYSMNFPPFNISRGTDNATAKNFFDTKVITDKQAWNLQVDVTAGDETYWGESTPIPSAPVKEYDKGKRADYSLEGALMSSVEEEGTVRLKGEEKIETETKTRGVGTAKIRVLNKRLGITMNSSFELKMSFTMNAQKNEDNKITGYDINDKNSGWMLINNNNYLETTSGWFQAQYPANDGEDDAGNVIKSTTFTPDDLQNGGDVNITLIKKDGTEALFSVTGMGGFLQTCIREKMLEVNKIEDINDYKDTDDIFAITVTFTASFVVPESDPMTLSVIRPVVAVQDFADSLRNERDGMTDETGQKIITLSNGDSLLDPDIGVSQKFQVKTSFTHYNSRNYRIKWSWVPEGGKEERIKNKDVLLIPENGGTTVTVQQKPETVKGYLVARVFYTPIYSKNHTAETATEFSSEGLGTGADAKKDGADLEQDPNYTGKLTETELMQGDSIDNAQGPTEYKTVRKTAVIPITIIGTGERPKVNFTGKIIGEYVDGQQKDREPDPNVDLASLQMGTYDGGTDSKFFTPPSGEKPYKYEGTLWFGTLASKAERLVIEHKSIGGGEVEFYTENDKRYTYGTDIQNQEEGYGLYSVRFMIKAVKKGSVELKFNFYNRAGDVIDGGNGVYWFRIDIEDNSPNPDPTLSDLKMKIHYDTEKINMKDTPELFESLQQNFKNDLVEYGFQSDQFEYGSPQDPILLPNATERLSFLPTYTIHSNTNDIVVTWIRGTSIDSGEQTLHIPADTESQEIPWQNGETLRDPPQLEVGYVYTFRFECTAQTGARAIYTLYVERDRQSDDAALESLGVYADKTADADNFPLDQEFDPEKFSTYIEHIDGTWEWNNVYTVHVPFRQKQVDLRVVTRNHWASKIKFEEADDKGNRPATVSFLSRVRLNLSYKPEQSQIVTLNEDYNKPTRRFVVVTAENNSEKVYAIDIYRNPPSENYYMQEPKLSYWLGNSTLPREENPLALQEEFDPTYPEIFTDRVPYSTGRFKVIITPEDYLARQVTIKLPGVSWEDAEKNSDMSKEHHDVGGEPQPIEFIIEQAGKYFDENNRLDLQVRVDQEDPDNIGKPYTIHLEREEPNTDVTANITLTNTLTNAQVTPDEGFDYNNIIDDYNVEIEYTAGNMQLLVQVEPTAPTTTVQVQIDDKDPQVPRPDGTLVKLTAGETTVIKVILTAEDGKTQRIVTINAKYLLPSKNCYLKDLKAGTLLFRPIPTPFDKKKLNYKIEIPKGMTTIPITAWLLDDGSKDDSSKATITINDKKVGNGEAYNFTPSEKTGKIKVVVTAQDGKTKRTYTISYKNWNMLKPNDEDMLKDLWVDYADMQPKFDSSITEYEVYLKPEAMDIKVFPKLRDSSCKIEVTAESKVLTEFEDYYSTSLMDDEMDIHVYVWSEQAIVNNMSSNTTGGGGGTATVLPDKEENPPRTTAREYILHLYRNDDEKIGNFKPLPAEDVDFVSSDPIVIDITQYPIISADVFKTLKEDYPDKSIIFKGNDYTLQIFGADIDGIIPNIESFDLRFSFRTPDEKKIRDAMDAAGNNSHIEPVYYYFNQHGALPAEMLLTVDLGRHYSNETLFWNYYNQERDRIDYYGYVHTNAKGTFSVPISHFSTYLSTDERIRGAENKSDEYGNPIPLTEETENLNSAGSANKDIPNTAAPISFTVPTLNQTSAAQQPVHHSSSSAGSAAVRATTPTIDIALPERKKISPVRKKSTGMPTGILK